MGLSHAKSAEKATENGSLSLAEIQARVDRVSIDGLGRTKDDIIIRTVSDNGLFKTNNFAEMLEKSQTVKSQLDSLGCFQNVFVQVDTSSGPGSTPEYGYEVTFVVRELKQIAAAVNGTVGTNNECLVVASARAPNILGRGEKLEGEISLGNKQTKNYNITLSKPIHPKYRASVSGSVFAHDQEWPMSKYNLRENGVLLDLSFYALRNLKHSLQWEGAIREITVGNRFAAFEVRENAGSTLKSSLRNVLAFDTRKTVVFPTSGLLLKLTTELAGLGGNVGFLKNDVLLQVDVPIIADFVLQGSLSGGCILTSNNKSKSIAICDNFFLGGPNSFRGFEMRGASPSIDGTYVGAKMFWQAGVSLFTPLPFRPSIGGFGENFRTHLFANVGNIGSFKIDDGLQALIHQARLACGIGLALRLGHFARLEINYCLPTWVQEGDRSVQGIQIGISAAL